MSRSVVWTLHFATQMSNEKSSNFYDNLIELIEDPSELTPEIKKRIREEVRKLSYIKRKLAKSMVKTMPIPREIKDNPKFVYAMSVA